MELTEIVQGCRNNDRKAQEELYHIMRGKMMSKILEYTNNNEHEIAEEIFNDGMLRVYKKIHLFNSKGSFIGWCQRILKHAVHDHMRASERYRTNTVFYEKYRDLSVHGYHNDALADKMCGSNQITPCIKMTEQLVYDIIKQNAPNGKWGARMFEVFRLHQDGFPHSEIAKKYNITVSTSKWYLNQAREMVKKRFTIQDLAF